MDVATLMFIAYRAMDERVIAAMREAGVPAVHQVSIVPTDALPRQVSGPMDSETRVSQESVEGRGRRSA